MSVDPGDEPQGEIARAADIIESIASEALGPAANSISHSSPFPNRKADELSDVPADLRGRYARLLVGQRIGPYEITGEIGEGVVGTVYRAKSIEEFSEQLAIKVINRRIDSDVLLQRFEAWKRLQAAIGKHPNIPPLLDAGTTEDGLHYLVMEDIPGRPIDEYCNSRRLGVRARIELLAHVCDAVHLAHQHTAIHCDLKPSNILVTSDGVPKLTDFVVSRLIQPQPGSDDVMKVGVQTRVVPNGLLVLTPEYASPEQVKGESITTASDIYALGVVLYELLAGRQPYQVMDRLLSDIFAAICQQVPERPSTAVSRHIAQPVSGPMPAEAMPSPEAQSPSLVLDSSAAITAEQIAQARGTTPSRLKQILSGDLDAIVLLAMRKEPEARYASAAHFADDLRRYLRDLPVRARRDSMISSIKKLVRRHRVAVAAGTLLTVLLIAGLAGMLTGFVITRRERDRARESAVWARQSVNQFFDRVSKERLFRQPGLDPLRKSLLQDAQRFYEGFVAHSSNDSRLRPELAAAYTYLAQITAETEAPDQAVAPFHRAALLWANLIASEPENVNYQEKLARTLADLGECLARLKGRNDEALDAFRRAQRLLEPLVADEPASASRRHDLGLILQNIAQILFNQGQFQEAVTTIERVLVIESQLVAENPGDLDSGLSLAKARKLLAEALVTQPDGVAPALLSQAAAVEILERITREHPDLADPLLQLAIYLGNLSDVQQMDGKLDSALKSSEKAIGIFEQLDRQYPGVLNYQGGLAGTCNLLSDLHRRRHEPAEALTSAQRARDMLKQLAAKHPDDTITRTELAKSYNSIGRLLQEGREPVEALQSFQHAVDLYESMPDLDDRTAYSLACNLALSIPLIGMKNGMQGTVDAVKLSKADRLRRERYGNRVVEVLRRILEQGSLDLDVLQSDNDLDPIRDRTDFQDLLEEVDEKTAKIDQ
jgi:eukaryotic-like serine/threonine-protein kinase